MTGLRVTTPYGPGTVVNPWRDLRRREPVVTGVVVDLDTGVRKVLRLDEISIVNPQERSPDSANA